MTVIWSATAWTLLAALVVGRPASAQETSAADPAQCRLIWTESPQTRAVVAWTTGAGVAASEDIEHHVRFDTRSSAGDPEDYGSAAASEENREFSSGEFELVQHHAALTDLQPDTVYYFRIRSGERFSREYHFRTASDEDRTFAILQGGDSRSDRDARQQINRRIAQLAHEDDSILALAHGGDFVWNGLSLPEWSAWMTDHELTVTPDGRMLPIIPARGNHEAWGALFDEVFVAPGGGFGSNYFATRLSPGVLLVTLNTEVSAGGRQRVFLENVLEQHADARWKVVQYHRAIWPAVKAPAAAKQHWPELFEAHGVDLVCESDGHVLKRTVPIRGDQVDPEGVVYIGEGGFGVKQRQPRTDRWYLQDPGVATPAHHVWELRFGADVLTVRALGVDGQVLDRSELHARVTAAK